MGKENVVFDSKCTDYTLTKRKFFLNLGVITSSVKSPDGSLCKSESIGDVDMVFSTKKEVETR